MCYCKNGFCGRVAALLAVLLICIGAVIGAHASEPASDPSRRTFEDAAATAVPDAKLDYTPGQSPEFWSVATADTIMARWPDYSKAYFNAWTYVNGYALCAFERLYEDTGDRRYLDYIQRYLDQFVDQHGRFRDSVTNSKGTRQKIQFTNLDNMMTGNTLVLLYERTGDKRYRAAATTIRRALDHYPRNRDHGFWHATSLQGQMWIDGVFMGQMFLTRYGKSVGDTENAFREAARQILVYDRRAQKSGSGLHYHGVYEPGHGERKCRWADPVSGLSPEVWSEGEGWYALVVVETLAVLPTHHPNRPAVETVFHSLAGALKRTQDPATGRWYQVVDRGDRPDNWTDTSGSAMFTYALQRGINLGLIDGTEFAAVVQRGYGGITARAKINDRGLVDVYGACDGLGVQRDYDHYIHYKQMVNAKEAVAGFLWATEIVERARLKTAPR
jgi:unsaturated rhamnogalacturonyl hydrolase